MKKYIALALAIILGFTLSVPALAATRNVDKIGPKAKVKTAVYSQKTEDSKYIVSYVDKGYTVSMALDCDSLKWARVSGGYVLQKDFFITADDYVGGLFSWYNLLQSGDSGSAVKNLQLVLIKLDPSITGSASGSFGSGTLKYVKEYQERCGLTVDGIVGYNTKLSLVRSLGLPPPIN